MNLFVCFDRKRCDETCNLCAPAVGVSRDCCHNTYCGSGPVSEKEAQAVTQFVGSRVDQILCFLTIHSAGQLLLLPYGHPHISAPNYDESW